MHAFFFLVNRRRGAQALSDGPFQLVGMLALALQVVGACWRSVWAARQHAGSDFLSDLV
jgi:hypothetical protein